MISVYETRGCFTKRWRPDPTALEGREMISCSLPAEEGSGFGDGASMKTAKRGARATVFK